MAYSQPPERAVLGVALIAGSLNGTLIAAPGAGQRIRVVGGQLTINRQATGVVDLSLGDSIGTFVIARGLQLTGTSVLQFIIPEPGIVLPENDALILATTSTAAAGQGQGTAYFYYDFVAP